MTHGSGQTVVMASTRAFRILAVGAMSISACGSGSGEPIARPITIDESNIVADALSQNYAFQGADFRLAAQLPGDTAYVIEGSIDWLDHIGRGRVIASSSIDTPIVEVVWNDFAVAERIPELTTLADSVDREVEWIERPADLDARELDSLLAVITAMAATQRDNPALLRQAGVTWLRTDTIDDIAVDVYQYSEQTRLWLDDEGVLRRFESNNSTNTRPVIVDLSGHRPIEVTLPPPDQLTPVSEVADLYDAVIAR